MSPAARVVAVCFDATGTLIEPTASVGEVYRRVALEHGVDLPAWRLDDAFSRVLRHAPPRGLEGSTREERVQFEIEWWFERIRQTFQATDSTIRFDDFKGFAGTLFETYAGADAWRVRPGMSEVLRRLAEQDLFLAVTSNFDHRLPIILEALGLNEYFSLIEIPAEAARRKPDRAVFEAVAQRVPDAENSGTSSAEGMAATELSSLAYVGDDAPEVLSEIARHGLQVHDIREVEPLSLLVDRILAASTTESPLLSSHPS